MGRMVWGGWRVQPGPSTGAARRLADERSEREELQRGPGREARTLLDVVVRQSAAVLELLAREDQTLLVGRDALLVLDLGLDVIDRVRGLDLKGDGLASERLDEDLYEPPHQSHAARELYRAGEAGPRPCGAGPSAATDLHP